MAASDSPVRRVLDGIELSQAALAEVLRVDRVTVSRYASGALAVPGPVAALCDALLAGGLAREVKAARARHPRRHRRRNGGGLQ